MAVQNIDSFVFLTAFNPHPDLFSFWGKERRQPAMC